ncbi:RNA polymerase sigma factor [Streptomyces nojiriensis]
MIIVLLVGTVVAIWGDPDRRELAMACMFSILVVATIHFLVVRLRRLLGKIPERVEAEASVKFGLRLRPSTGDARAVQEHRPGTPRIPVASDATLDDGADGGACASPASLARLDEFVRTAYPAILRSARRFVSDRVAEDVAQEALLSVLRNWERVAEMSNPVGYAVTAARNLAIDSLRRHQREILMGHDVLTLVAEGLTEWEPEEGGDVEVLELVRSAVSAMPGQRGEVLRMRLAGLSDRKIAASLGVTPSTVAVQLHRARKQLIRSEAIQRHVREAHLTKRGRAERVAADPRSGPSPSSGSSRSR